MRECCSQKGGGKQIGGYANIPQTFMVMCCLLAAASIRIKRGKTEEYLQTEEEMREAMLDMGTEGVKVVHAKENKVLTGKQLKERLRAIIELKTLLLAI